MSFKTKQILAALIIATSIPTAWSCDSITQEEVIEAQKAWGKAIVTIGKVYSNNGNYKVVASKVVDNLYGYEQGKVLFKPTKAAKDQFRETAQEAKSYFVTGIVSEDKGFAIQPWSNVRFENNAITIDNDSALAMGNYYFTDANTHKEAKVEYTFGYFKDNQCNLRINLHHSSFPYVAH